MDNTNYKTALWGFSWDDVENSNGVEQGIANLTSDGIFLEIPFGELFEDPGRRQVDADKADYILGFSQGGDYLALKNTFLISAASSFPGGKCQTIRAQYLFAGRRRFDPDAKVMRLSMKLSGLNEWVGKVPFATVWDTESAKLHAIKYDSENSEDYNVTLLEGSKHTISIYRVIKVSPLTVDGISVDHECVLEIYFADASTFENALEVAHSFSQFVSYCLGYYAEISELKFQFENCVDYVKCHGRFMKPMELKEKSGRQIPIRLVDVKNILDAFLGKWLYTNEGFGKACSITTSLLTQSWDLPEELRFIAAAQALEALSRVDTELTTLSTDEYEEYRDTVKTAISSIKDTKIKEWFLSRLPSNNKGQRKLLTEMFARHPRALDWIIDDKNRFVENHIVTRNYYTHLNEDASVGISPLRGENLYWHTESILLLCYVIIGCLLGYDEEEFIALLTAKGYKNHVISSVKKLYTSEVDKSR